MKDVLDDIDRWRADGHRIAVRHTCMGAEGSPSARQERRWRSTMPVTIAGSVSGGCVEGAVVTEARGVLADGVPG